MDPIKWADDVWVSGVNERYELCLRHRDDWEGARTWFWTARWLMRCSECGTIREREPVAVTDGKTYPDREAAKAACEEWVKKNEEALARQGDEVHHD